MGGLLIVKGTSQFDVSFGNTTAGGKISGEIKYGNDKIELEDGKIGFSKTDSSTFTNASSDEEVKFQGTFFGPSAGELGGSFKGKKAEGTFGATR